MENLGQTDLNYIFVYHKLSCRWQTARHICAIRNGVANASTPVSVTVQNFIVLSQMLNKGVQMLWENIAGSPKTGSVWTPPLGIGLLTLRITPLPACRAEFYHCCMEGCCGHWDSGFMAPSGGGTGRPAGDWKTDGQHYRRCQGVHFPVPAAVRGTTERECGLISKHVHRQLARCNPSFHFLNALVPGGFVLASQKNNNVFTYVSLSVC